VGKLRRIAEWALAGALLVLWPLHWLLALSLGQRRYSVWTGRPIITLGVKARAERLLGVPALSVVTQSYHVSNEFDRRLASASSPRAWRYLVAWAALAWALLLARRIHTFHDAGFLPPDDRFTFNSRELWLYRAFGLQHLVWSYGADVRTRAETRALGEPNCCTHCDAVGLHCICDSAKGRRNVERIARHATLMATMGDMNEYVPMARKDLFFWPLDLSQDKFAEGAPVLARDGRLRVVHAPNHPQFKGSHYLLSAIEQLQAEGVPVELVRVERMANEEALLTYRTADVVFDQCLIGFHGYFALEALALGKPVMVFIRKPSYLLHPEECPLINVTRETIADTLRALSQDRGRLAELGRRSREYVARYYGLQAFAQRLAVAYQQEGIQP
jgi:glycosyltransferase involved in cell wall biosynthesis